MAEVFAIKSAEQIERVQIFLTKHYGTIAGDCWRLGINLALRVGDMLAITTDQARESLESGYLTVVEQKTSKKKNKPRVIKLNKTARAVLRDRLDEPENTHFIFQTIAKNRKNAHLPKPISYRYMWQAFKDAGDHVGVKMGTHTMRKTRGYMMHKAGIPIEQICKMFCHSHPSITMLYIGLDQESLDRTYDEIEL